MNRIDRFKNRKKSKKTLSEKNCFFIVPDQDMVEKFLNTEVDYNAIDKIQKCFDEKYDFDCKIEVTNQEANDLLKILEKDFSDQRFNELMSSCKNDILQSIVVPFGLGSFISKFDKNGGNVTTVNNFEQGITSTEDDAKRYSEWKKSQETFNRTPYDFDEKFDRMGNPVLNKFGEVQKTEFNNKKKKEIYKKMNEGSSVIDGYTGKELGIKKKGDKIDKKTTISLEHITPVKEIETNSKIHLFAKGNNSENRQNDRVNLARNDNNLNLINGLMNSSKGDIDLKDWANKINRKDKTKTNAEFYNLKKELYDKEYRKSKNFLYKENLKRQFKKQGREILNTGVHEGLKMGFQQALGFVMFEFFSATFDELNDIYKNDYSGGFEDKGFFHILKERLKRVAKRVTDTWKDASIGFKEGFISGFLSNLVTVVINMFVRTGKRVVRIIREGFFSLLKAIKILCFPPKGMTIHQAAHESSKLIASGLVVMGGIVIEQNIDNMIKATPLIEPFADIVTSVLVGGLTGLSTTFIVYAIDKIDYFKVNDKIKHDFAMKKLENNLEKMFAEGEKVIGELSFCVQS